MINKLKFLFAIISIAIFSQNIWADESQSKIDKPIVAIETSMGTMTLELDPAVAPKTVENFMNYVRENYYDKTIFHRVINRFMIQGGGFTEKGWAGKKTKKTKASVPNESHKISAIRNDRGTIAMARTSDPHSATSQFFINHKNNSFLNTVHSGKNSNEPKQWGYTVFGRFLKSKSVESEKTLDKIAAVKTAGEAPVKTVFIKSVKHLNKKK